MGKQGPRWTGKGRFVPEKLAEPIRWRGRERVFVDSMSDLFFEGFTDEEIAAVFGVMAACPQHDFLVLTKRPARAREWFQWIATAHPEPWTEVHWLALQVELGTIGDDGPIHTGSGGLSARPWPLPNVWLGVSVEDQATADERIPVLLDTPAALRFVSAEPLLGPVNLARYLWPMHTAVLKNPTQEQIGLMAQLEMASALYVRDPVQDVEIIPGVGLDWVIVGGESGPGARPCAVEWIGHIVEACAAAGVPAFVKQLGAKVVSSERVDLEGRWAWQMGLKDRKGGDPDEWGDALRVRQFPTERASNLPGESEAGRRQRLSPTAGRDLCIDGAGPKSEVTPGG
jgi:protein gp37